MGTRCGDIDVAIVGFLIENEGITYKEAEDIFNKKSGFLGLSGSSNDCRELERLIGKGDKRAGIALENFCYNVKKYIGAYAAAMNGVDCIVFTGGIGENSSYIRENICSDIDFMGACVDKNKNDSGKANGNGDRIISSENSRVTICIINTNEELMIGYETIEAIHRNRGTASAS
jgi:acetate kinase